MPDDMRNLILYGDALSILKTLAEESVNCIVTSPPYYSLRDYQLPPIIWDDGWSGSLGLEPDFHLYLKHMMQIMDECKRVLRKDGTFFLNMGDSYACSPTGSFNGGGKAFKGRDMTGIESSGKYDKSKLGVKSKSMLCIPERLCILMVDSGWILRNKIVWHKPNCLPSSAKDRFTNDFEPVYFFTKSGKYCFERQFESMQQCSIERHKYKKGGKITNGKYGAGIKANDLDPLRFANPLGRNMRTVWKIPSQPYKESHFATYPEELVRRCIKAGCPEHVCTKCGKAREKVFKSGNLVPTCDRGKYKYNPVKISEDKKDLMSALNKHKPGMTYERIESGYSQCSCVAPFEPGIVLDPFAGSGTTGAVAKSMNRDYILIEPNPEYIKFIEKRLRNTATQLTVEL